MKIPLEADQRTDSRYRRGAALVAVVFPLIVITLTILAFAELGLEGLRTHGIFVAALVPGIAAGRIWIIRYTAPAITALRSRGKPVAVGTENISFFGRQFPYSARSSLLVEGKKISLLDGDQVLATEPIFFIKSRALGLNQ